MRFVRPTLTIGGRRLLATLEHKPWAPDEETWVAAFPWSGDTVDVSDCWLDVAPGVLVPLSPGAVREPEVDETELLRAQVRRLKGERDRASQRCDEAIRDREAAMRTRERMESQRDEATRLAERAQAAAAEAQRARDDARAQRDDALGAYRALQDQLRTLRAAAAEQPPRAEEPPPAAEESPRAAAPSPTTTPALPDGPPLGVKAIPAARAEGVLRPREYQLTAFDLYAFRIVGGIAAACFVVLMIALLKVFI